MNAPSSPPSSSRRPRRVLITGSSGYVGQHLIAYLLLAHEDDDSVEDEDEGDNDNEYVDVGGMHHSDSGVVAMPKYELYCAYRSLSTFECELSKLISEIDDRGTASTMARRNRHRRPLARVARMISGIDFATSDYANDILRGSRINDDEDEYRTFDIVIHLAAMSSPAACESHPDDARKINCPLDLLTRFEPARVIYVSTDQVYDGAKSHNDEIIDAPNPVNVYGRTKLSFERALLANDMRRGGGGAILRCSLILGPTAPLGGAHTTFLQFIEGRLNDGIRTDYYVDEYRSCIHVDDVIRAIVHFMDDDGRNHEDDDNHRRIDMTDDEDAGGGTIGVYNLGGRTRASRHDMAMAVASRLGLDASFVNAISRPKPSGGEVGVVAGGTAGVPSPPDISMNIERITNVLRGGVRGGGRGMMDLEEIVAATFPITTLEEEGGWE